MEESKLINLWNAYEEKFTESYSLIQSNVRDITQLKIKSFLSSMKPIKFFTVFTGILWVFIISTIISQLLIHAYAKVSLFFIISASIQVAITAIAIIVYVYQLMLIYRVDVSKPVLETQQILVQLKTSTLRITRILFLQFPVWTTFYINENMFADVSIILLIVQLIITGTSTFGAIWLFFNIKYENRNKRWFRLIFNGKEWTPLINSMDLIEQLNDYKN